MMITRATIWFRMLLAVLLFCGAADADDPGRDQLGNLEVRVFFGTNGDAAVAGDQAVAVEKDVVEMLQAHEQVSFKSYRLLGNDTQPVYRSYENWAEPITGSDAVLCRFEVEKLVSAESLRLDLELWLRRKKILKSAVLLSEGKPMLVLGPEWRGGNFIISVELTPKPEKK